MLCSDCPTDVTITTPNSNLSALFIGDILTCRAKGPPSILYSWYEEAWWWGTSYYGSVLALGTEGNISYTCRAETHVDETWCQKSKTINITASYGMLPQTR